MKRIPFFVTIILLLSSCGGQLYKTFEPLNSKKYVEDPNQHYDLDQGTFFNFRLAQVYKTVIVSGEEFGNQRINKVYQEVPIKTYMNVSDTNYQFPNRIQEEVSIENGRKQLGQDMLWDNIVVWLEGIDNANAKGGDVIYMTTKRLFPTRNHREFNLLNRITKKKTKLEKHKHKSHAKRAEKLEEEITRMNERFIAREPIRERSFFIRQKIANNDTLDFTMMDTFYLGRWTKKTDSKGRSTIQINLAANSDEATTWFEMDCFINPKGSLVVESVSNNVVDLLSSRNQLEKKKIAIKDIMEIQGDSAMTFFKTPHRKPIVTNFSYHRGKIKFSRRFSVNSTQPYNLIECMAVYTKPGKSKCRVLVLEDKQNKTASQLRDSSKRLKVLETNRTSKTISHK